MKTSLLFATSCLALSIGQSAAFAATAATAATAAPDAHAGGTDAKDYAKLSIDGAHAFQDVALARLAIFDGKPAFAVKLVADAKQSMDRAKTDDTVFMKAEADLKPAKMAAGDATAPATGPTSTAKIAWVPIDGELALDETLAPSPEKSAAIAEANEHLRKGEPDKAHDVLKVASVTADYTLAVAPLKQSTADIAQASTLLASRDYYGASQALRQAQDAVRYETTIVNDKAVKSSASSAGNVSNG
jgi:hypothetical protein